MYTSILIPTDGSELAGKTVQHAFQKQIIESSLTSRPANNLVLES